jgi:capsular exopolysaccharide synthesis family protein
MSIRDYVRAVVHGWWMVVIAVIVGAGVAILLVATTQPIYAGSVTFFVNTTPVSGVSPLQGDQYAQQRVATYVRLVSSDRLAELVKEDTGSTKSVGEIANSVTGESPLNTVLLTATVTGPSGDEVLTMTESVSTQFVRMIRSIDPTVSLVVTSGPTLQPSPVTPRTKLDIGLGIVAGLVVGAGAAIARRALDTTVRSAADLRSVTGADVLGVVGRDRRAGKEPLLVGSAKRSARTEAFRKLRTNLRSRLMPDGTGVIVVTSSVYGEGKSATAANLAIACADDGHSVLLMDADLRRPALARLWGLAPSLGLTDVLDGTAVDTCLHRSKVDRLMLLPSGRSPSDPAQAMGSMEMTKLLAGLRDRFDIIVIDAPPLLPVTDAAIATGQADGAVVVVRYGKTRVAEVTSAIDALEAAGAPLLGCVINMAPAHGAGALPADRAARGAARPSSA